MALNPAISCFLTLEFQDARPIFSSDITIKDVSEEKMLGVTIDNKPTFESHLKNIRKKANQKLNALVRVTNLNYPSKGKFC